jgi:hypothetical protein
VSICKCGREFDPSELPPSRVAKGQTKVCGVCFRRRSRTAIKKLQKEDPAWLLYTLAKGRAKRNGLDFNIEREDCRVPEFCPVLGMKLIPHDKMHSDDSPTLDRIDNKLGYVKGNVWVISMRANKIKNNSTLEELKALVTALESIRIRQAA